MREAFKVIKKLGFTKGVELGVLRGENAREVLKNIPIREFAEKNGFTVNHAANDDGVVNSMEDWWIYK